MPCFGIYPSGIITHVIPVYKCDITETELVENIVKVLTTGILKLAEISAEEWKSQKKPMFEATGIKSWKEFANKSIGYGLEWIDNSVILTFSSLYKQSKQEINTTKTMSFAVNTPLENIVQLILEDIKLKKSIVN